ncbi:TetR/AcrR family transcriptional regulator [Brevibacterium antiquum]|uniref:Transcriptional regulator, TetR family n=1 Tax=Brevibacterium antiquum TaxID=234835 RepID=A0A2H1KQS5_9MICO|nr:TetR/AcrR family transcriptional regulator [Brevibacterium antiquum]SMY01999.1 transcriptional regulator, TetR family [Brevibacterium antiquum]
MKYSTSGERVLDVASRLFYAEGIGAIGVDRIVEESGVSKPTLYTQFKSKAGLIAAVLERRHQDRAVTITAYLHALPPETESWVLAFFDWFARSHAKPGFRGCPFTNAAAELPDPDHPARQVIADYKTWTRQMLTDLADRDGLPEPQWWGSTLMFLIDGANARVITISDTAAILDARNIAASMIAAAAALPLSNEETL